jgi:hypothetical protein
MLIEPRDRSLKYPRAIKQDKLRLVLDWLLEFRFSSLDVLAQRIVSRVNYHVRFRDNYDGRLSEWVNS